MSSQFSSSGVNFAFENATSNDRRHFDDVTTGPSDISHRRGVSPWGESTIIVQLLLPLSCAVFISIVVLIVSCCLIKKRVPTGLRGQKNFHATDTSECGIYDVIDEIRVIGYHQHQHYKTSRRPHQLNSHFSANSRCEGPFYKPYYPSLSMDRNCPDPGYDVARIPQSDDEETSTGINSINNQGQTTSCLVSQKEDNLTYEQEQESIYETLDKNWKFKYETESRQFTSNDADYPAKAVVPNSCQPHSSSRNPIEQCVCPLPPGHTNRRLVCQLSLFEINEDSAEIRPTESKFYYMLPTEKLDPSLELTNQYVKNTSLSLVLPCANSSCYEEDLTHSNTCLKNNVLRLEPIHDVNVNPGDASSRNIELTSPAGKDKEKENQSTKTYQKIKRALSGKSKIKPKVLVRKSESFKERRSSTRRVNGGPLQRRRSDSFGSKTRPTGIGNPTFLTQETARILSKLGPLPPVPKTSPSLESSTRDSKDKVNAKISDPLERNESYAPKLPPRKKSSVMSTVPTEAISPTSDPSPPMNVPVDVMPTENVTLALNSDRPVTPGLATKDQDALCPNNASDCPQGTLYASYSSEKDSESFCEEDSDDDNHYFVLEANNNGHDTRLATSTEGEVTVA